MPLRNLFAHGDSADSNEVWIEPDSAVTGKVLGYFGRTTDRDQIKTAILARYGTRIRSEKSESGSVKETYVVGAFDERINAGHVEIVSSGFGHNLSTAVANLFTEPGLKFSFVGPGDLTKTIEFFDDFRENSQFLDGMVSADKESFQLGCSVLWLDFYEGRITYRTVDPGKLKVRYDSFVEADGESRPVNYMDIEDATCVIIETGAFDGVHKTYTAIFGRSIDYPNGRYVSYKTSGDGKDVPEVGAPDSFDWREPGTNSPANPLSWYAEQNPDENTPEYPVAIFYGGHVRRDRLFPVTTSVLMEALEADMTASHLRAVSNDNARGARAVERTNEAAGKPLPQNLYGNVALEPGQKLNVTDSNNAGAEAAWKLLKEGSIASAQGYGVPDYMVSSEDHTLEASSGVALKVRSAPLLRFREERININRPTVDKVFYIERSLISLFSEAPEAANLEQSEQSWEPGTLNFPEDPGVQVANVKTLVDMGWADTIEAIQILYQLPSESEAIDRYKALKKRAKKYPPLNASEQVDSEGGDTSEQEQPV